MNEQHNTSLPPVPPANKPAIPVIVPEPGWFSYSGRYTRAQFWGKWIVCSIIVSIISHCVGIAYGDDIAETVLTEGNIDSVVSQLYVITVIELIVYTLFLLPLWVKRLHDVGMSTAIAVGVWALLQILGFVEVNATLEALENMVNCESLDVMIADEQKMLDVERTYTIIRGGIAILMIIVLCFDSQKGSNLYGPSSKYPDVR